VGEPGDDKLMKAVSAGDQTAFRHLVKRHLPTLHRYLTHLTGSAADGDELSQEAFLRVWQSADKFRPGKARFTTWLHRIGHNLYIDEIRRTRPDNLPADLEAVDEGPGPEQQMQLGQESRLLKQALSELPEAQRSALLLCQVQGFSNQEAAVIMDTGVRAVESLLARGRRGLRQRLARSVPSNVKKTGPQ
jgi:RNA polymerase sigma-70 factor (ECF subfamily)